MTLPAYKTLFLLIISTVSSSLILAAENIAEPDAAFLEFLGSMSDDEISDPLIIMELEDLDLFENSEAIENQFDKNEQNASDVNHQNEQNVKLRRQ